VTFQERCRAVVVEPGFVTDCPECGNTLVSNWTWDFGRDPEPERGPIEVQWSQSMVVWREVGTVMELPCTVCALSRADRPL
jgi:hypothetical protein